MAAVALATGCIDPDGKYQDFVDRTYEPSDDVPSDSGCPDLGDMELPEPAQLSGTYYYVVSLPPYEPTVYLLEAEATRDGGAYSIRMRNRPLLFADKKTQTGAWSEWHSTTVGTEGCYELTETVVTPMDANALMLPVTSTLSFSGNVGTARLEGGPGTPVQFWCGTVVGEVTSPANQAVSGTFTATRLNDASNTASYPPIVINCAGDPS